MAGKPLTVSLGEVLWDILPDGKALGGAPTNVAWHAAQLGADAHVVSAVGDDDLGMEILRRLREMRLNVTVVATIGDRPTSTVEARLDDRGNASYVIHENVAWDHLPVSPEILALAARADAVNFGSLAQRHPAARKSTLAILDAANPDAIRIFDINLRPPFIDRDVLDGGLRRASVVKMNEDELPVLADLFSWDGTPETAMARLLGDYPNLRHAIVTRGCNGAWWRTRERLIARRPAGCAKVVDTIGAGDSVTAASMMGLLKGWDEERILETALEIASFVCGSRGGTPELPAELKAAFLENA
jgi:fructokinase